MSIPMEAEGFALPYRDGPAEQLLDLPDRLLDLLPVAVCICDRQGVIVRYNRLAVALWGRAPRLGDPDERFCGSHRIYRLGGDPLPHSDGPMAMVLRTGISVRDEEVAIERPDGSRAVAVASAQALKDGMGTVLGAIACFHDITERKRAESEQIRARKELEELAVTLAQERDQLQDSERLYRALIDAQPAAIYTTDIAGRITYYNEAAAELWGYRPELGKTEFCGSWKLFWPDGRPMRHDECPMAMALKEQRPVRGLEAIAERPDGTRVTFMPFPTPLFDASGNLAGAVNMLVDITDRHRQQAEVHAQQERFRALVEASAQIVWTTDRNGLAVEDSPSWRAFTGQSYERLKGAGWLDAIHPDDRERVFASWSNAVHSKTSFKVEYRMRHASGDWRWTLARAAPVFARDGTVAEWVGMNIDITERKAAEQALQVQKWRFETLNRIAKLVSSELDVDRIVQTVTDVATELSGAKFGAFFYSGAGDRGESHVLYALSGAPREAFASLGTPRNTALFEPTFRGTSVIRADDIRTDRRFGQNHPHYGMPKGHLPVVSYLAIPVGRLGKVHGALLLGHPQPGVFTEETEEIVTGVAAHAAIAIDNASLYQVERRLASIVETSDDAIVSKSLDGIVTSWNLGAERLFGYTAGEMIGKSITIVIPADRHTEEADILERIRRGERVEHYETVRMRKDGSLVDISLSVSPVKDADGRITGASKIARDITERKQAQARQELLTREIHHRTKNLFAVVHAVVARSFADKRTVKEAEAAVLSRLHSFAQTHVLLIEKEWQGADIAEVVRTEMEPYAGRVSIEGETVFLNAQAAQNFALALHELATNAAKYGALSNQSGRVFISWRVFKPNGHRRFTFRWQERGGPPVAPPLYRGFGSAVLERVMAEYFDTPPQIEFARNGVCYELSGSLEAITGQA